MSKHTPLTKEYFESHLDKRLKSMQKEMTKDLKGHVTKEVGDLAAMTAREFGRVHEEFGKVHTKLNTIETKVDGHEKRLARTEDAIGMPKTI